LEIIYKLFRYSFDDQVQVTQGPLEEDIANIAMELCSHDKDFYTYRLEVWISGKHAGGWRFFQNGREFTDDIKRSVGITKDDE
jgi:hypothetical protein